jgi:hypothetical protein
MYIGNGIKLKRSLNNMNQETTHEISNEPRIPPVKLGNFPRLLTFIYMLFNETNPNVGGTFKQSACGCILRNEAKLLVPI